MKQFLRKKTNSSKTEEVIPMMLHPNNMRELMGNSRLNPFIWYKALWKVQDEPGVNPYQLGTYLGVSWRTAEKMKVKVKKYLSQT